MRDNYRAVLVPEERTDARTVQREAAAPQGPAEPTARLASRGLVAGVAGLLGAAAASAAVSWQASARYSETHVPVYSASGEIRGMWVLHAGLACEVGRGAAAPPRSAPEAVRLGLGGCWALCEAQAGCEGVARAHGSSQGECGLRWRVDTERCAENASRDFWHLVRRGRGAGAQHDLLDGLPAEPRRHGRPRPPGDPAWGPTVRPGVPDLPDVVFDDSEDAGAAAAEAAGEIEWNLHPGVLCKPSDESLDRELDGSVMQCREACLEEPRCEAMQTLRGRMFGKCRLLGGLDMKMCTHEPGFDLWQQVGKGQGNIWEFRPVDGGKGRECQGEGAESGNGSSGFKLYAGASRDECKDLCRASNECQGIQHEAASARCKVWTAAVRTSAALAGSECLAYVDTQLLPRLAEASSSNSTTPAATTTTSTTAATTTTTTRETCPACAPKEHKPPAIVIPTFQRDLCKMKFTAKSISKHDPDHHLGDVHVAWVMSEASSNWADEIDEIRGIIEETRGFHLHDFSQNLEGKVGWFAQQIFKLKIAQLLTEEFYIVLDSKNTFIRDVEANSFFSPCHQAYNFAQYTMDKVPDPHNKWYHKSAEALNLDISQAGDTLWPASITPMTMHRQTVLDMLESIGEDPSPYSICGGPLCGMMEDGGVTEFTAYQLYAHFVKDFECIHKTSPPGKEDIAISLWRGFDGSFGLLEKVASKELRPTMFGSQASALDGLPEEQRERVPGLISQVFRDAGLLEGEEEQISDCVIAIQDQ